MPKRRSPDDLSPDVEALLEIGRPVVPVSPTTRARAEARARASLATPASKVVSRPRIAFHLNRWAAAAAIAFIAGIAGGAAAYEHHLHAQPPASVSLPTPPAPRQVVARPSEVTVLPDETPSVEAPTSPPSPTSRAMLARAELHLVQRARAAMIRRDFPAALSLLAEHAQRFRDGRLAEEREALRVKALVGLGRTQDARRVFTAFAARFPRSPLLPALSHITGSTP